MSRKYPCLLATVLLCGVGLVQAEPRQVGGAAERLWVWNLGDGPAEGGLWIKASEDLDAGKVNVETRPAVRPLEEETHPLKWSPWVLDLISASRIEGTLLGAGDRISTPVAGDPEVGVKVAIDLQTAGSSVRIRLLDAQGEEKSSLTASNSRPVRWQADLGTLSQSGLVELTVLRGKARGVVRTLEPSGKRGVRPIVAAAIVGSASFNYSINWPGTPALTYTVSGGPASTCGELNTYRNGSWLIVPGWLCTDATGYAQKGPWSSSAQDQTDNPAFIRWPNGDTTNTATHVWDVTCPTITRTSSSGAPPTSLYGNATDPQWGAGFNAAWSNVYVTYTNLDNGNLKWTPAAGSYSTSSGVVYGTISGMPSHGVSWSFSSSQIPPAGAHTPGDRYRWTVCISDGGCASCTSTEFTY